MAFEGLVAELKRLIRDRVPGSQAKESVESFGPAKFYSNFASFLHLELLDQRLERSMRAVRRLFAA